MAFRRFAYARVTHPRISAKGWGRVRTAAKRLGGPSPVPASDLRARATEILGQPFTPENYLLTHATIVASVDTDPVPDVKLGKVRLASGKTINRRWGNYYVKPECSNLVNNNGDAWTRAVLLASYPTFVGGHNFQEHIQVEELSKGRIIDAAARDIGNSVYIDILVATDRRHKQLVKDIESGKMGTLSMGCTTETTQCTKCGNVAIDDTDTCDCIRYHKLDTFYDRQGTRRVIAELCGNLELGDTGGVVFIEASWVAQPAFTGAVLRNVLTPAQANRHAQTIQDILNTPPRQWTEDTRRVASALSLGFNFNDDGEEEGEPAPTEEPSSLDDARKKLKDKLVKDVRKDIEDELDGPAPDAEPVTTDDNIHHQAYQRAASVLVKTARSEVDLINKLALLDNNFDQRAPRELYLAALSAGGQAFRDSPPRYLLACQEHLGFRLGLAHVRTLRRLGSFLSLMESHTTPTPQGV